VDGVKWKGQIADDRMLLLERMGMSSDEGALDSELIAPMPGKVLSLEVQAGDEVKEGDSLLILEAMKMENVLKSSRAGKVLRVDAVAGQAVEKGAVLITFADE
jgi:biotin carboxyl carrier protein